MTVAEMLSRMTSHELAEHMAYDQLRSEEAGPASESDAHNARPLGRRLLSDLETDAMMRAHQRRAASQEA